eukprot:3192242-Lingulodinium_polyedra.AAC.1
MATLVVEVEEAAVGQVRTFSLKCLRGGQLAFECLRLLDPEAVQVHPTRAMAPMQQFLANGRKQVEQPGLCWLEDGEVETALRHAARD